MDKEFSHQFDPNPDTGTLIDLAAVDQLIEKYGLDRKVAEVLFKAMEKALQTTMDQAGAVLKAMEPYGAREQAIGAATLVMAIYAWAETKMPTCVNALQVAQLHAALERKGLL